MSLNCERNDSSERCAKAAEEFELSNSILNVLFGNITWQYSIYKWRASVGKYENGDVDQIAMEICDRVTTFFFILESR